MTEVVVVSKDGLRQEVRAGRHVLAVDEPANLGGTDAGPSPYELLLAALGACTSMTLLLYARRRQWPLEGVEVRLRHDRIHARDCAICAEREPAEREGYLDYIHKEIRVRGPLTPEQIARLGEIAEKCPVQRTLQRPVVTSQSIEAA